MVLYTKGTFSGEKIYNLKEIITMTQLFTVLSILTLIWILIYNTVEEDTTATELDMFETFADSDEMLTERYAA